MNREGCEGDQAQLEIYFATFVSFVVNMGLDTRFPLEVAPLPEGIEVREYVDSWKAKPAA